MIQEVADFFKRIGQHFASSELQTLEPHQVEAIARDVGVTTDELYELDLAGSQVSLMPRRLEREGIEPVVVQAEWPSVWKDLQRVCTVCASKDVCRHDLDAAPDSESWRRYCPNENTIKAFETPHS